MQAKKIALNKIKILVQRFEEQKEFYKKSDYNETQTRRDFIDPFWKALGWDIDNESGYAESYRDVVMEDKIQINGATKKPDYSFRYGGQRLFFLEAKKPSTVIKEDSTTAYQIRRYGWSAKMAISVITDFEEFAIYDCTNKPKQTDKASTARIKYITYQEYLKEFDFIWETFAKENVPKGSFDKFIQSDKNKKGTTTVDDDFLELLGSWRVELARNIALRNKNIDEEELNFVVQQTIDRIVFLRIAEDRTVEKYGDLQNCIIAKKANEGDYYKNLLLLFQTADQKYNSGLFDFSKDKISTKISIDNKIIKNIISEIYYPNSPYEFSVLSVEILGSAYEQFLGKTITLSKGGRVIIEEKPEVRKAGGVYYTPQYIVNYIVENTVGKLIENKTPQEVSEIKIVDPACGSGSFLIGAYDFLLKWHKDYYLNKNGKSNKKVKNSPLTPTNELTTVEKKRILLNNIFGTDLDSNAVEVTKLSLLLKCMEGETNESIEAQSKMFKERVLPNIDSNIKSGNSLIDIDFYENEIDFKDENRKIKPFSWQGAFPEIFKNGGFDCVIGNPPYVSVKEINKENTSYYTPKYEAGKGQSDLYSLFIERGISLLSPNGFFSYIVPDSLNDRSNFINTRKQLLEKTFLRKILTLNNVFRQANVGSTIFVTSKIKNNSVELIRSKNLTTFVNKEFQIKKTTVKKLKNNDNYNFLFVDNFEKQIIKKIFAHTKLSELTFLGRGEELSKKSPTLKLRATKTTLRFLSGEGFDRYLIKQCGYYIEKKDVKKNIEKLYGEKIIVRQVGKKITATVDEEKFVTPQSVYTIVPNSELEIKYLLALLNSKLFDFIYQKKYKTKEIFPRILLENLKELPIKVIDPQNKTEKQKHDEIIKYVDILLYCYNELQSLTLREHIELLQQRIEYTIDKIDAIVYELYGLTAEEIGVVEGR